MDCLARKKLSSVERLGSIPHPIQDGYLWKFVGELQVSITDAQCEEKWWGVWDHIRVGHRTVIGYLDFRGRRVRAHSGIPLSLTAVPLPSRSLMLLDSEFNLKDYPVDQWKEHGQWWAQRKAVLETAICVWPRSLDAQDQDNRHQYVTN